MQHYYSLLIKNNFGVKKTEEPSFIFKKTQLLCKTRLCLCKSVEPANKKCFYFALVMSSHNQI